MDKEQAIAWLVYAYLNETKGTYFVNKEAAEQAAFALNILTDDHYEVLFKAESHGPTWHVVKL